MKRTLWTAVLVFLMAISIFAEKGDKDKGKDKDTDKYAGRKSITLLAAFGGASELIEDAIIDVGVEFQVSKVFFFQLVLNSHMGEDRRYGYYDPFYGPYTGGYYGGNSVGLGLSINSLHGISTYWVLKTPLSRRLTYFAKGGAGFTFYSLRDLDENGYIRKYSTTGLGLASGTGFDYALSGRVGLMLGLTYKYVFDKKPDWHPEEDNLDWLKVYMGINFRVK
jgi:hypothetical protein